MRGLLRLGGVLCACAGAAAAVTAVPAAAQGSYSPYDESRDRRRLRATSGRSPPIPRISTSLIGAGKAALELGDAQAAAGFFARADEVNPRSPLPQAGMGAVSVANGDAAGGAALFRARPAARRASRRRFGCDRGLAYDLLGQQAEAQADYRAALERSPTPTKRGAAGAQPRDQRRPGRRAADARAAVGQGRSAVCRGSAPSSLR